MREYTKPMALRQGKSVMERKVQSTATMLLGSVTQAPGQGEVAREPSQCDPSERDLGARKERGLWPHCCRK
jgi:hypothetical protein